MFEAHGGAFCPVGNVPKLSTRPESSTRWLENHPGNSLRDSRHVSALQTATGTLPTRSVVFLTLNSDGNISFVQCNKDTKMHINNL